MLLGKRLYNVLTIGTQQATITLYCTDKTNILWRENYKE